MEPHLHIKLVPERRLQMTFALGQALEILQMPRLEFAQWLSQEIEKNPVLEEISSQRKTILSDEIAATPSLYDHILSQMRASFRSPSDQDLAKQLLEYLDEKGFLSNPIEEIALTLQKPLPKIQSILATLQTFDPPGLFASNLQESLLLQLKIQGDGKDPSFTLIQNCFDDLIHGRYSLIKRKIGSIDLGSAIEKLSKLRLRPSYAFKKEPVMLALPDLKIIQNGSEWTVQTEEEDLPKFRIRTEYESICPKSSDEKEALSAWFSAAKWLSRSLKRRRQILMQIGVFLVKKQARYLTQKGNLRPLTLQELGEHLHLHESTLSRAISGKYADTPRGLIPLRSLLSASPSTNVSKEALYQILSEEDPSHPLTDEELSQRLSAKGYKVARRTIAKYRKELKIGPISQRKNLRGLNNEG